MAQSVATVLWDVTPALVLAIDARLGAPVDSYLNGSQTWFTDDGPGGVTLEWRLHPVAGYHTPKGCSHYDVWETVVAACSADAPPTVIPFGAEDRALAGLWDGLEAFAAYDDDIEPQPLAAAAGAALGMAPDQAGMVDHQAIGDEWERTQGRVSVVELLRKALAG
jgi:hypothetical protein